MNVTQQDVKWFFQTYNKTELAAEIRKEESSLKTVFKNHREMLDQQHFEFKISVLKQLKAQTEILPQWYTAISDIPADLNSHYADDNHFCILEHVELNLLISLLSCGNRDAFLKKEFYRLFKQAKTDAIAGLIRAGNRLIPPSISYHAESGSLKLEDGRHRFRSALVAEQRHIPIVITKNDYAPIFKLLFF